MIQREASGSGSPSEAEGRSRRYFHISPHPSAPLLSDPEKAVTYLDQLAAEVSSSNFQATEEVRDLMRQASIVSLWFFLKFVAGFAGPFDKLNTTLHREMCNFAQIMMLPGKKGAAFIPRFHYKTTIFTTGSAAWHPVRNPNIRIKLNASKIDRGSEFLQTVQRIYDSNELFGWLFPDHVPPRNQKRWNSEEMLIPCRTRHYKEPTIKAGSVGEASEGDHFDGIIHDDIIGKKALDIMGQSGLEMANVTRGWKIDNSTLIQTATDSWIFTVGTRYGLDDTYEEIMKGLKRLYGYRKVLDLGGYREDSDGEWVVYYRCVKEEDETGEERIVFPEAITQRYLDKMLEDDPWTYWTQMVNLPHQAGMAEFLGFTIHECEVVWRDEKWWIFLPYTEEWISFGDIEITGGLDPAWTESGITAKTSKSAVTVWGQDAYRRKFLIDGRAGYVSPLTAIDWIFQMQMKYMGAIRTFYFEKAGGQKFIRSMADEERLKREVFINFDDVPAQGDKNGRIRTVLGADLEAGRIYVNKGSVIGEAFKTEAKQFPNAHMKDILDSAVVALAKSLPPLTDEDYEEMREQEERFENRVVNSYGW